MTWPVFFEGQPNPTCNPKIFLKNVLFFGKKKSKIKTILVKLFIVSFKETIDTFT